MPDCSGQPNARLQHYFAELFSRQLPHKSFHLQIKKRGQHIGGIEPSSLPDVINRPGSSELSNA
jgi:hypothetical protein